MKSFIQSLCTLCLTLGLILLSNPFVAADEYEIDASHTYIGFAVKHLLVSTTKGSFGDYTGNIRFDPNNLGASNINVTIKTSSIDTRNSDRDNHLRTADFFDVENFPVMKFQSKSLTESGNGYLLSGDLTIKDVTKAVEIPVTINGPVKSPFGFEAIGIVGELKINRQEYGITWNKQMDQGGFVVGDEVDIEINLEAHKKQS